jgi:hypothetical protein
MAITIYTNIKSHVVHMPKGTPQETEMLPGTNGEYLICRNGEIAGTNWIGTQKLKKFSALASSLNKKLLT